ncbi:hypothetical protein CTAYLR_006691 [Chrysophaeum taylorii]|uniref:FAD-binding FR-type domain-containing protein n=1 Tax=Chrysophaeum taylorii TaxID=2483200 RepID=A0AAD7UEA0_9STRA|nr:hypothetical protein CTAYLR_006691 [Chrysophaeum taylorii]
MWSALAEFCAGVALFVVGLHEGHVWMRTAVITGVYSTRDLERGGIAEYYRKGEFRALLVWTMLPPLAVIVLLHSSFGMYRRSLDASSTECAAIALTFVVAAAACVFGGVLAQKLANRNKLWDCGIFSLDCNINDDYDYQQTGLISLTGFVELFVFAFLFAIAAPLAVFSSLRAERKRRREQQQQQQGGGLPTMEPSSTTTMTKEPLAAEAKPLLGITPLPEEEAPRISRDVRTVAGGVAGGVVFGLVFACAALLPTSFETFVPSAIKSYVLSRMRHQWSSTDTSGWRYVLKIALLDSAAFKFWPDLLMWYGYLAIIALVGVASRLWVPLRRLLARPVVVIRTVTVGEAAFWVATTALFVGLTAYWRRRRYWAGSRASELKSSELWARIIGQLANATIGLLVLPVTRNSVWSTYLGVGWDGLLRFHVIAGNAFLLLVLAHAALWYQTEKHDLITYPLGFKFPYPNASNWTVALVVVNASAMLVAMGILARFRRTNWELFKWSHHIALAVFLAVLWHANMCWYYLIGGLALYSFDRYARFAKATLAADDDFSLVAATCLDGVDGDDYGTVVRLEYASKQLSSHFPGQYAWLHAAEASALEWHPFTISSGPTGTTTRTHHIKVVGAGGSWTRRLAEAAREHGADLTLSVDGPYGLPPSLDLYERVVFVAGGIGVTPIASIIADQLQSANDDSPILAARLLWVAKSRRLFDVFSQTLRLADLAGRGGSVGLSAALYESRGAPDTPDDEQKQQPLPVTRGRPNLDAEFENFIPRDASATLCFACGPVSLVAAARNAAVRRGAFFYAESFEL